MKFIVERTSISSYDPKHPSPCDGAKYSKRNKKWYIELKSLGDLLDLQKKVKFPIIIDDMCELLPIIEIYDDYRE